MAVEHRELSGLVILGCVIIDHTNWDHETAFLLLTALFGTGFMLYAIVITLIVYRLCYTPLPPAELDPSFWVTAGAVAITTLAGSELILRAGGIALSPIRAALSQGHDSHGLGIRGLVGDHAVHSRAVAARTAALPLCLHAGYWSMVFPMGMFTACTIMCSKALGAASLMAVPRAFIYVALASWLCTFWGMGRFLWRSLLGKNAG